ncbi:hypothetical protein M197_gp14 [Haloarcula hispanica tailed virus 2]|uniref:Uncharacterized protein n=1 Tax=Haloarcula hispanica tailed virus 2 TaxID=1273751 RepID=R4T672_9CAUD|nr:hypothetical protein M197_gp14 [Haloarcula hispanica tailed virus 2]AGM11179.1 hypothetical protein HHTV2_13 [Haloarcula hispanica tailed virus 2]
MSLDHALRANITVHEVAYRYEGGEVRYRVDEDADQEYRAVYGGAYREPDGERVGSEVDGVRLTPTWTQRLRERLTSYEYEPLPEWRHVQRVTEELEAAIDTVREAESRHEDCEVVRRT